MLLHAVELYSPFLLAAFLLAVLIARWFAAPQDQQRSERMIGLLLLTTLLSLLPGFVVWGMAELPLPRYDLFVYRLDTLAGVQWSFVLGRLLLPHAWGVVFINVVYSFLGGAVMLAVLACGWYLPADRRAVYLAFALNFLFAPLAYAAFPVCGPRFAFANFPADPGPVLPHLLSIAHPPNGVPSVHLSTALLLWWFCRRWRGMGRVAAIYAALMVVVTLASGQHYLFDLVMAVPYTVAVVRIAEHFGNRVARVEEAEMVPA